MSKRETSYQASLIKKLRDLFEYDEYGNPIGFVWKSTAFQGMPDIIILCKEKWATLEVKRSIIEELDVTYHEPNQDYYVSVMNRLSYSNFISPDTEQIVIQELLDYFNIRRNY